MIPIRQSELPPLEFDIEKNVLSQEIFMQSDKISWLQTLADQPGASYDITIRDDQGRVRFERQGFGTEHEQAGERIDVPTLVGERLYLEISNPKNVKNLKAFIN